jgi:hypothetical protein
MNTPDSMAKNMPKIAEVKLSSCGFKVAYLKKNCDCGIAVAEQHFFKSCGIAIAEGLPSSCGIAVADSKKGCACPPLGLADSSTSSRIPNYRKLAAISRLQPKS